LASAAALALSAVAPVTDVPNAGPACGREAEPEVAAAGTAVVAVELEEPQPAIRPPRATVAAAPAIALR
jgi:hypothetical protein